MEKRSVTIRQGIVDFLREGPKSMRDISKALSVREKDLADHLESIEKSLKSHGERLRMQPFYCNSCGFEFKNRKKYMKPGKCPECRNSHIGCALFHIE